MKIGFLSARDPTDSKSWSGLIFYFYNALKSIAEMRQSSRDRYETTLNWTAWAAEVRLLIEQLGP